MPKLQNIMRILLDEERKGNVFIDEHGYFRSMKYFDKARSDAYIEEMRKGTIPLGYSYEEYVKTHPVNTDGYVKIGDVYESLEQTFAFDYNRKGRLNNATSKRNSQRTGSSPTDGDSVD